jgi:hypothetical protein
METKVYEFLAGMCSRAQRAVSSLAFNKGSSGSNFHDAESLSVVPVTGEYIDNAARDRYV